MGSTVTLDDIAYLRTTRRLPRETEVAVRLPRGEWEPRPEGAERVVFFPHFKRGFGLPARSFFRDFLEFFGLQPHHLGTGAIVQLSGFVTLCQGYLGGRAYDRPLGALHLPEAAGAEGRGDV